MRQFISIVCKNVYYDINESSLEEFLCKLEMNMRWSIFILKFGRTLNIRCMLYKVQVKQSNMKDKADIRSSNLTSNSWIWNQTGYIWFILKVLKCGLNLRSRVKSFKNEVKLFINQQRSKFLILKLVHWIKPKTKEPCLRRNVQIQVDK